VHPTILATLLEGSSPVVAMCCAGIALLVIGILAAKNQIAEARGLDKIVALSNACFASPIAVFGALHLFGPQFVQDLVPPYMPWRMFSIIVCAPATLIFSSPLPVAPADPTSWSM